MPTLIIEPEKIYELVDQLNSQNKLKIFERLKPQILSTRWDDLIARIDERKEKYPIDDAEIEEEVERAREEASSCRR
jgi:hypothetical protein